VRSSEIALSGRIRNGKPSDKEIDIVFEMRSTRENWEENECHEEMAKIIVHLRFVGPDLMALMQDFYMKCIRK
jgi:hypothetical protein